ncbi:NADPH:quinone oxidoreductase family protein [Thioclava sp. 'Guangxiensis']|uniref:NADPH:quinone oxidoreductase family protein n=1 Tax=Thioclava sp. 'Guangxiensis' TaxID=3149044 RepID=UPI003877AC29
MTAFQVVDFARPPEHRPCARPEPEAGELLIRIHACGLNFADLLMMQGRYQDTPAPPFTLGLECAGEVVGRGVGCTIPLGTRVAVYAGQGGLAEYGSFPEAACIPLPPDTPYDEAAGLLITYGTSHLALTHTAGLRAGETLAVIGAAGGVGLTAVEIGAQLGARVIAVARGAEKCAIARTAGAAETIDSDTAGEQGGLKAGLKALGGVDVVYDAVGGTLGEAAFRALNRGGRFLLIGFAGGTPPALPLNHALVKNISIHGLYWGGYREIAPQAFRRSLDEVLRDHAAGRLRPHVSHRLPFTRLGEALELLRNRQSTGKIVIAIDGSSF